MGVGVRGGGMIGRGGQERLPMNEKPRYNLFTVRQTAPGGEGGVRITEGTYKYSRQNQGGEVA